MHYKNQNLLSLTLTNYIKCRTYILSSGQIIMLMLRTPVVRIRVSVRKKESSVSGGLHLDFLQRLDTVIPPGQ